MTNKNLSTCSLLHLNGSKMAKLYIELKNQEKWKKNGLPYIQSQGGRRKWTWFWVRKELKLVPCAKGSKAMER